MPLLKIERVKQHSNWKANYDILIDDIKMETIKNNEVIDLPVSEGAHTIKIAMRLYSSPVQSFTISEEEIKTFRVHVSSKAQFPTTIGYLFVPLTITAKFIFGLSSTFIIWMIMAIIFIFCLDFIGRGEYFSLETVE